MERVSRLLAAARGTGAYVDFEFADWQRSANIRQKVLLAAARPAADPHRLILSTHDFQGRPSNVPHTIEAIQGESTRPIAKIAYQARHINDSFAALDWMHDHGPRLIAVAMGEDGLWTRVLAKKLGAFGSYASVDSEYATAPGQLTIEDMLQRYRWPAINESTRVYGVIGDPLAHSLSPTRHNHWFAEAGINAVYLPLRVRGGETELNQFFDRCRSRPYLDISGFSVTIPHKESALRRAGGAAESMARWIGAANTLVFDGPRVRAYNTDCYAFTSSLADALECSATELHAFCFDVLGTGGAARAILYGLRELGCRVCIYGRSPDRTRTLADEFGFEAFSWADRARRTGDVLINATNVGLWPHLDETSMPPEALSGCRLVYDLIYRPLQTRLLSDASARGIKTANGLDMFLRQAAMQFELWTGRRPDLDSGRRLLLSELSPANVTPTSNQNHDRQGAGTNKSVALIGMRGSGKTTVGRALARHLNMPHIDTDHLITTRAGLSIAEIFARDGESGFRERERKAVAEAVASVPAVISVGGGAVLDSRNVEALRRLATVVWLTAPVEELWRRISADPKSPDSRPSLTGLTGIAGLTRLCGERASHYQQAAHHQIDTVSKAPEEVAQEITRRIS
jgi:3-dehydroquinate dehydratase/shikimate dehydrogenase